MKHTEKNTAKKIFEVFARPVGKAAAESGAPYISMGIYTTEAGAISAAFSLSGSDTRIVKRKARANEVPGGYLNATAARELTGLGAAGLRHLMNSGTLKGEQTRGGSVADIAAEVAGKRKPTAKYIFTPKALIDAAAVVEHNSLLQGSSTRKMYGRAAVATRLTSSSGKIYAYKGRSRPADSFSQAGGIIEE